MVWMVLGVLCTLELAAFTEEILFVAEFSARANAIVDFGEKGMTIDILLKLLMI